MDSCFSQLCVTSCGRLFFLKMRPQRSLLRKKLLRQVKPCFIQIKVWYHYSHWGLRSCCWYSTDNFSDPQSSSVTQQQAAWRHTPGGRFGLGRRGNRTRLAHSRGMSEMERCYLFIKYDGTVWAARHQALFRLYLIEVPQDASWSVAVWAKKRHSKKKCAV